MKDQSINNDSIFHIINILKSSGMTSLEKGCYIIDHVAKVNNFSDLDDFQMMSILNSCVEYIRVRDLGGKGSCHIMIQLDRIFTEVKLRLVYSSYSRNQ